MRKILISSLLLGLLGCAMSDQDVENDTTRCAMRGMDSTLYYNDEGRVVHVKCKPRNDIKRSHIDE